MCEAGTDHSFAACFNDAGADKEVLATELGVTHDFGVLIEVVGFDADLFGCFGIIGVEGAQTGDQPLDLVVIQQTLR